MAEVTSHILSGQARQGRRKTKLREVAYLSLKQAILSGKISPDFPLVEEHLASELQISRTPVREALAILEHEGLIENYPYQGLFVKEITLPEFLEMYESLEVIEPQLAAQAAEKALSKDLVVLEELLERAEQAISTHIPDHLTACRLFQQRMGECAGNSYLTSLLIAIEERVSLYMLSKQRLLLPEKMKESVADRRSILDCIRAGDSQGARMASYKHALSIRARWRELYIE